MHCFVLVTVTTELLGAQWVWACRNICKGTHLWSTKSWELYLCWWIWEGSRNKCKVSV